MWYQYNYYAADIVFQSFEKLIEKLDLKSKGNNYFA